MRRRLAIAGVLVAIPTVACASYLLSVNREAQRLAENRRALLYALEGEMGWYEWKVLECLAAQEVGQKVLRRELVGYLFGRPLNPSEDVALREATVSERLKELRAAGYEWEVIGLTARDDRGAAWVQVRGASRSPTSIMRTLSDGADGGIQVLRLLKVVRPSSDPVFEYEDARIHLISASNLVLPKDARIEDLQESDTQVMYLKKITTED